jgi:hypothetical protein
MIRTSKQLKDKVKNISNSNAKIAQAYIRTFIMERFLERVSISEYHDQFILKGGMLVASLVGIDLRSTMDIDTTVRELPINEKEAKEIIRNIITIPVDDGVSFKITTCKEIMSDFEYPGIRVMIEARLDKLRQMIKIDISTDDVITPRAIEYEYNLMFEDRTISVMTYNLETLLAEKLQTVLSRDIANTRMRDFYDIYSLTKEKLEELMKNTLLNEAFIATCKKRETTFTKEKAEQICERIFKDKEMENRWMSFKTDNYFVGELEWKVVMEQVYALVRKVVFVIC